jgi:sialidase-1
MACLVLFEAVALLCLMSGGCAAPSAAGLPHSDVFVAGQDGVHTFRIPSIIVSPKGSLLAFSEARRDGQSDAGDIDLVVKRSRDGGLSWSSMSIVVDDGPNTFGDPCPVVDARTGVIWLLATRSLGSDGENAIIAGTSREGRSVWVLRSEDDGETWSAPIEITSSVKKPDWTWYATGPGVGIQMGDGRLVIPANHAEAGTGVHRSHLVFSEDGGRSWQLGASADAGTNESQVVELADGRLMLNMRNHPPKERNYRMVATSSDGGRTLSPAREDRGLLEPPAQGSFLRLSTRADHGRNRLLFANPASAKRERLTLKVSYDEGESWPVARTIYHGPSAYSSLVVLPDRTIGVLFERGDRSPYEKVTFARVPLEWLTGGREP